MTKRFQFSAIGILVILSLAACGGDDNGTGPEGPKAIQTGTWNGTAGFGSLSLEVTSSGTLVQKVSFTFSSWRCGSASGTSSGTVSTERDPGWPITDRAISISVDYDPFGNSQTIDLDGTFGDDGTSISGSWSAAWNGGTCSGSWQASR
jgi:hypothetical protein